jgi:hypothetical protein
MPRASSSDGREVRPGNNIQSLDKSANIHTPRVVFTSAGRRREPTPCPRVRGSGRQFLHRAVDSGTLIRRLLNQTAGLAALDSGSRFSC